MLVSRASGPPRPAPRASARLACCALAALLAGPGCQSGAMGPLARWRLSRDSSIAPGPTREEAGQKEGGLMARWLSSGKTPRNTPKAKDGPALVGGSDGWSRPVAPKDPEADAELKAAEALFQKGDLETAEKELKRIAKARKETPWGEKAQYLLAETRFQRGNYVGAHDAFEELHSIYPGTQYLEKLAAREYAIALDWLGDTDKAGGKADPKAPPKRKESWKDRFTGRVPLIDREGHAISQVLEHVRHNDPTGPLADDAVLRIADYHYGYGNYEDAALYYDQLLNDHPKSPHYRRAQLAAIDSKIKAYLGPEYDGAGLEQARESIKRAIATSGERTATHEDSPDQLYHALDLIEDQQAERAYTDGEFYRRTGYVTAAEYCFGEILQKWPKSEWSKKARVQMAALAKMPRKDVLPSKILTTPGSTNNDPYSSGMSSASSGVGGNPMGGMGGGMGMPN